MKPIRLITSSLRAKLLAMFIILTSVPLLAVGLISYQKSYHTVSDHSKAASILVADQLVRSIDVLFQDTQKLMELGNNPKVLHFLISQSETSEEAKEIVQTFELYRDTYKYDSVLNIQMVNLYGKGISERRGVFQIGHNPLRSPHFVQLTNDPETVLKIPPSSSSEFDRLDGFTYPDKNVISIIAAIKQRVTHEVIGFIVIDLDDSIIEQFCDNVTIGKTGFFYVLDPQGIPIFMPSGGTQDDISSGARFSSQLLSSQLTAPSGSFIQSSGGEKKFVVHATSETTGWSIIGIAPLREIIFEANEIRLLIFASVLLSAIFAITLHISITQRLTRPIQLLKNKMRQAASGFLEAKVKPSGHDEIADLSISFNIMLENIKLLLEKSIREQEQVQKAELRTLQAQINPHFLYNTLDSIVWMAESGENESVIKLVKALSRLFRLTLNKGREWISLKTELEHAQSYLTIQQMRYRDILSYEINVPSELQAYPMLGMTLQPLIENAIYHGIKNKRGMGFIRISGHADNERSIILTIEDNGIGMTPERLDELRLRLEQPRDSDNHEDQDEGGFGLQNVHQRLRLYFGEQYGLQLESTEGAGARVSLRIPKK